MEQPNFNLPKTHTQPPYTPKTHTQPPYTPQPVTARAYIRSLEDIRKQEARLALRYVPDKILGEVMKEITEEMKD